MERAGPAGHSFAASPYQATPTYLPTTRRTRGSSSALPRYKPQPTGTFATGVNHAAKPAEASDGLSNTLLIGEKLVRSDMYSGPTASDDYGVGVMAGTRIS